MNKKILVTLGALALVAAAASAQAGDRGRHRDDHDHDRARRGYAEVVYVEPIHERVRYTVPVEQCWDEERIVSSAPARHVIVGTLIGAAIGKHVGDAHGDRALGTVGGALIGAAVGSNIARERGDYRDGRREVVRRCETRYEERWDRQVVAYRVSYVYRGRHDVVRLAYDPGRWYRVDDPHRHG
jgi:uncharacterized protein YcfJ